MGKRKLFEQKYIELMKTPTLAYVLQKFIMKKFDCVTKISTSNAANMWIISRKARKLLDPGWLSDVLLDSKTRLSANLHLMPINFISELNICSLSEKTKYLLSKVLSIKRAYLEHVVSALGLKSRTIIHRKESNLNYRVNLKALKEVG